MPIEFHGVLIGRPLCRNGHVIGRHCRGQCRIPACEGVALKRGLGGGGDVRVVVLCNGGDGGRCAAVGVERNRVLVNGPLGVEGDVFTRRVGVAGIAHKGRQLFVAIPTTEGVVSTRRRRQDDAAVRPFGKEIDCRIVLRSKVVDQLTAVIGFWAVSTHCPAIEVCGGRGGSVIVAARCSVVSKGHGEGTAVGVGGESLLLVVGEDLAVHRSARFAVAIEDDVVGVGRPLSVECHRAAVGGGEVADAR